MITPEEIKRLYPIDSLLKQKIAISRQAIANIVTANDQRLLVVCGPCSIHDPEAALDYADRLCCLANEVSDQLYIVMRVYFEKPRTAVGWKGLINDPYIDGSFDIEKGLQLARYLAISLAKIGLPLATEFLDPHTPQYLGDLFSWSAIGARTIESQVHREIASSLPMPIGFKNNTDGNWRKAINAMKVAAESHYFIGMNQNGQVNLIQTQGNLYGHIILRGGKNPNYTITDVAECGKEMADCGLIPAVMIDCSHGNSKQNYRRQPIVAREVIQQIVSGNQSIIGIMLESYLLEGNQRADQAVSSMKYGVSITDPCIDWITTKELLCEIADQLRELGCRRGL